ncbi:MAG: hypothetical protein OEW62_04215 [Candidatus Bathyarchaeota archaeon]|nr:hypothetical protein [Candidatus Bathyarchaeota archaeon]
MKYLNYKLSNESLKIVENATLLKNERCVVDALEGSLALPILIDEKVQGYVFHGTGKLVVDSIIETARGAVGKPTVKDLKHPFMMLGGVEEIKDDLDNADTSDLQNAGYESVDAFIEQAEELCGRLLEGKNCHVDFNVDFNGKDSRLFAFLNEEDKIDILVSKNDKLVYKSEKKVYLSKGSKSVLKRPKEIIVSKKGKTVVIANNGILIEK